MLSYFYTTFSTNVGGLLVVSSGNVLERVCFETENFDEIVSSYENITESFSNFELLHEDLTMFLNGNVVSWRMPFMFKGTIFQEKVLKTLQEVNYGETVTYKALAEKSGYFKAYQAVGSVCAKNTLPFIIPCHRVLPANSSIGSFRGGVAVKKFLLELEK